MRTVPPPLLSSFQLEFMTTYKKEGKENQTATVPISSISICVSNQKSVANSSEAEDAVQSLAESYISTHGPRIPLADKLNKTITLA